MMYVWANLANENDLYLYSAMSRDLKTLGRIKYK